MRAVQEWLQEVLLDTRLCGDPMAIYQLAGDNAEFMAVYKTLMLLLHWVEGKQCVRDRQLARIARLVPALYFILQASNHYNVAWQMLYFLWLRESLPKPLFDAVFHHSIGVPCVLACASEVAVGLQ